MTALMAIVGVVRHCSREGEVVGGSTGQSTTYHCEEEKSLQVLVQTRVHHPSIVVEQENIPSIKLPRL